MTDDNEKQHINQQNTTLLGTCTYHRGFYKVHIIGGSTKLGRHLKINIWTLSLLKKSKNIKTLQGLPNVKKKSKNIFLKKATVMCNLNNKIQNLKEVSVKAKLWTPL